MKSDSKSSFAIIFSIASMIFTFVIMCICINNDDMQVCNGNIISALSVIVGILTLFVTVLIGWNIWSVIDLKSYKRKYEELDVKISSELNYMHNKADHNQALVYGMMSQTASAFFAPNEKALMKFQMLSKGLVALKNLSNFPNCEKEISSLMDTITKGMNNSTSISLDENSKTQLILMCGEIVHKDRIPKLNTIIELINNS